MKFYFPILLTSMFTLAGCRQKNAEEKESVKTEDSAIANNIVTLTPQQIRNAGIAIGAPMQRNTHSILKVNGVIDVPPQNVISVSFPLGGYLRKMNLLPGMHVQKGSVLAVLEDQQYIQLQQDYLTAKSRLEYLSADYNRQKGLNETKANSDKIFQQAKTDYEGQQVLVKSLSEKLKLIGINPTMLNVNSISRSVNLYSPINGYISKVNVNPGKYVNATDVLFELLDPSDVHLGLTVFERDVSYLSEGQKVTCYTNSNPQKKYSATIILVNRNIDENRASEVHCHFENYDPKLLPGMFMNAEIALNNISVVTVPEDAVVRWEGRFYVFIPDGQHAFKMLEVKPGVTTDGYTEIKSPGLPEQVVTKNSYALLMQAKNSGEE